MVKRLVLGSLSLVVFTAAAGAADMYAPAAGPGGYKDEPVPYLSWTGFYVGGNFGGGWQHSEWTGNTALIALGNPGTQTFSFDQNASGVLGGGQAGFNYQLPSNVVVGIEADFDWSDINGSTGFCSTNITPHPSSPGTYGSCTRAGSKLEDFGTLRGRLGYAFEDVLLYGTGGFAWGQSSTSSYQTCAAEPGGSLKCTGQGGGPAFTGGNASGSATIGGWAAGAGAEWRFQPNWSVRLEYLHLQFNNIAQSFAISGTWPSPAGTFASTTNTRTNTDVDIARVGVNYLFNRDIEPLK